MSRAANKLPSCLRYTSNIYAYSENIFNESISGAMGTISHNLDVQLVECEKRDWCAIDGEASVTTRRAQLNSRDGSQ